MVTYINSTNVIWSYQGYDDGRIAYRTLHWNDLPIFHSSACEYAFQNGLDEIVIKNGEYTFDLKRKLMYITDEESVYEAIPIKRSN